MRGSVGGLGIVDRAAHVVRADAGSLVRAILPASGGLALVAVCLYYAERVLAVSSLRPVFAAAAAALLAVRAVTAGVVARHVAAQGAGGAPHDLTEARAAVAPRRVALARAGVVGALLDLPAILLAAWMSALGPLGAVLLFPIAGLRWIGASPTFVARVANTDDGVARAWWRAWRDGAGARGKAFLVETLLWLVAILVFANGYAVLLFGAGVAGALFDLDLAFTASFLSPSNGFAVTFIAVFALLAVEPLRMVAGGLLWVDARVRHDALDLRQRMDEIAARRAARGRAAIAAALLLAASALLPARAGAQDEPVFEPRGSIEVMPLSDPEPSAGESARMQAEVVLSADEFAPVPEPGEGRFGDLLREAIRDLIELFSPDPDAIPDLGLDFALPGVKAFLAIAAVILLLAIGFVLWALGAARRAGDEPDAKATLRPVDVRERDPVDILAEAEALRARGELRAALRTVYLATLVQLDRRRDIVFDPSRTNWQYLRDFPPGERRDRFATLTRMFDHKWYGHEAVSDEDVRTADHVARAILETTATSTMESDGTAARA